MADPVTVATPEALAAAVAAAGPGTTIELSTSVWKGGVSLCGVRGAEDRPVVIRGAPGGVVLRGGKDALLLESCEWVTIENLGLEDARRAGLLINSTSNIVVRRCRVGNNQRWGIQTCLSDRIRIEECEIWGSVLEHGIYFSTTDRPAVRRCIVRNNAGCGIHMNGDRSEGGDGMIEGATIEDNEIRENGRKGGAAINMDGVERSVIRRNRIHGNLAGGIACFAEDGAQAGCGNTIEDNVVVFAIGEGRYALQLLGDMRRTAVRGNTLCCGRGPVLEVDSRALAGMASDGNRFFAYARRDMIGIGDERLTLEQWRKRSGQDKESSVAEPDVRDEAPPVKARGATVWPRSP